VCGENVYAKHSIHYDNLPDYFLLFSVWEGSRALSWSETRTYADLLGLAMVPELYTGPFSEKTFYNLAKEVVDRGGEGVVVRLEDSFSYDDFADSVAKYVRENHVTTSTHWMQEVVVPNGLK
jgi:hypothetical protein